MEGIRKHTARLFSIIRTAMINGLDPYRYFEYVLENVGGEADRGDPPVLEGPRNPLISTKAGFDRQAQSGPFKTPGR